MNFYVDLSVTPEHCESLTSICTKARSLGFKLIGINASLLKKCDIIGNDLTLIPRIVLEDTGVKDLRNKSRDLNGLVVVIVDKLTSLRHVPSIKNIDVIRINPEMAKYIDKSQARLLSRTVKLLELPLPAFTSSKNNLYRFAIAIRRMHAYDIPYTLVSDAKNKHELWHPKMMKGLLELLGIPEPYSLMPITSFPLRVLGKFVLKLQESHV
ncbi:MAG: hypothetical protein F7B60_05050 [Desulfurococcales archaeon]|nr:hypothetical protein [Desulfurococcales archaeon]